MLIISDSKLFLNGDICFAFQKFIKKERQLVNFTSTTKEIDTINLKVKRMVLTI